MVKGIYIHIPFCSYKCPYCDFLSLTDSPITPKAYLELLRKEISFYKDLPSKVESVYFGGGTPTLLSPKDIGRILDELDKAFGLSSVKEITIECNPETYRGKEFREIKSMGINRISIGAQSFTEKGLKALGRKHSVKDIYDAIESAKSADMHNINVDLIFGWRNQNLRDIEEDIKALSNLEVKHVSWYLLTIHEDTSFGKELRRGKLILPEEEKLVEMHSFISEGLKELGFNRYEISNWSKRGYECKHNLLYWKLEEFLGLGVSAWGFVNNKRYGNTRSIMKYAKYITDGRKPVEHSVYLDSFEREKERLILGLRLIKGIPRKYKKFIPDYLRDFFNVGESISIKEEYLLISNELIVEVLRRFEELRESRKNLNAPSGQALKSGLL